MTDEEKQKRSERMKNYAVILLVFLVILPSCVSILLMLLVIGLRSDVKALQKEVLIWKEQSIQNEIPVLGDESVELSEDEATENIVAIENKLVWEGIGQNTQEVNSDKGIRKVYLTFDDGPSSNTNAILDILDEYGVKATFFVCGDERYTEEYQRIVKEGHTLGMHSYSHKFREIYQSPEAFMLDMDRLHDYLYEVTGIDSKFVRFPGGSSNTICDKEVMQEIIDYLEQEDITYYDWNVSSGDAASHYISPEQIAENVLSHVWDCNTAIVLMHDASGKGTTVEALPMIIEELLKSENTVLLPITEDTTSIQHVQAY